MSISLNSPRGLKIAGLDEVQIANPVAEWSRMQNNGDGTVTVVIDFFKDQATFDANGQPFETHSYQISAHANIDNYLKNELIKLAEFSTAT